MDHAPGDGERLTFRMSDGVALVGESFGHASDPGLLFAHGGGQTRHAWANVARRLGRSGWRTLALDLRGHGESDWSEEGAYAHARYGEDLAEVARAMGAAPVVVGASLGGNSAVLAAGAAEEDIFRAIVLVDVTPRLDPAGVSRIMAFMDRHIDEGFATLDEAAAAIAAYLPHRKRKPNLQSLARYVRLRPDGRYRWHWDPRFVRGEASTRLSPEKIEVLADAVRRIRVPILLVRGSDSELVGDEAVREFMELAPHAEFEDVTGAGHMIVGDRNDVFAHTLGAFLEKLVRGDARRRG